MYIGQITSFRNSLTCFLIFYLIFSSVVFSQSFGDHKNEVLNNDRDYADMTPQYIRYDYNGNSIVDSASKYYFFNGENRVFQIMFVTKFRDENKAKADLRKNLDDWKRDNPDSKLSANDDGFFGVPEVKFVDNTFVTILAIVEAEGLFGSIQNITHRSLSQN
jgi:hypothetical protein